MVVWHIPLRPPHAPKVFSILPHLPTPPFRDYRSFPLPLKVRIEFFNFLRPSDSMTRCEMGGAAVFRGLGEEILVGLVTHDHPP